MKKRILGTVLTFALVSLLAATEASAGILDIFFQSGRIFNIVPGQPDDVSMEKLANTWAVTEYVTTEHAEAVTYYFSNQTYRMVMNPAEIGGGYNKKAVMGYSKGNAILTAVMSSATVYSVFWSGYEEEITAYLMRQKKAQEESEKQAAEAESAETEVQEEETAAPDEGGEAFTVESAAAAPAEGGEAFTVESAAAAPAEGGEAFTAESAAAAPADGGEAVTVETPAPAPVETASPTPGEITAPAPVEPPAQEGGDSLLFSDMDADSGSLEETPQTAASNAAAADLFVIEDMG